MRPTLSAPTCTPSRSALRRTSCRLVRLPSGWLWATLEGPRHCTEGADPRPRAAGRTRPCVASQLHRWARLVRASSHLMMRTVERVDVLLVGSQLNSRPSSGRVGDEEALLTVGRTWYSINDAGLEQDRGGPLISTDRVMAPQMGRRGSGGVRLRGLCAAWVACNGREDSGFCSVSRIRSSGDRDVSLR